MHRPASREGQYGGHLGKEGGQVDGDHGQLPGQPGVKRGGQFGQEARAEG